MSRRRTVMHVINASGPGGAETVCVSIVRGLDPSRWRTVVVVPDTGWIHEELTRAGAHVVVVPDDRRRDTPRYLMTLRRLAREHDVSLLHAHLLGPSVLVSLLGLLLRIPVVCTLHGQVDLDPRERFKRIKFAFLRRATRVVFVSESLRAFFVRAGLARAKTVIIPNGVDVDRFQESPARSLRAGFGAMNGEFLVGAMGNVRPAKAYTTLLHAAALLKDVSPDYRFVIVGDAECALGDRLRSLRDELGLANSVRFAGYLRNVPEAMHAFDVYALSSDSEGFSIATVEAMAAGRPIVATRCGGPEEILAHDVTGVLVEKGSPEAMAEAIDGLRRDAGRRSRLGDAARTEARRRFSLQMQVRAYERTYEECMENPDAGRARE